MGMAAPDTAVRGDEFHTADMVRALIEEDRAWPRYETLYGELVVTPAPRSVHQFVSDELLLELKLFLRRHPVGVAFSAPADISWGRRDVLVQPDVFVVPRDQARRAVGGESWRAVGHLLLAVEIVSPDSARRDRFGKRVLYQRQGVEQYWVADVERGRAEGWTPGDEEPRVTTGIVEWQPAGVEERFAFDVVACVRDFLAG
jgi:Uma2 family endonuclease